MGSRVLLIGRRGSVLTELQDALRTIGIVADLSQDVTDADSHQLRDYAAVAFGRAVGDRDRARMKAAFQAVNPAVVFVDGLAPITPLLVAQFEEALDRVPARDRRIGEVGVVNGRLEFELREPARVGVTAYCLTLLYRTQIRSLLDGRLKPGRHVVHIGHTSVWTTAVFAVLRADAEVRVIPVPGRRVI